MRLRLQAAVGRWARIYGGWTVLVVVVACFGLHDLTTSRTGAAHNAVAPEQTEVVVNDPVTHRPLMYYPSFPHRLFYPSPEGWINWGDEPQAVGLQPTVCLPPKFGPPSVFELVGNSCR